MHTSRIKTLVPLVLAGLASVAGIYGCARNQQPVEMNAQPPAAVAEPVVVKHFVVTDGRHYYVDSKGALHLIVREVQEPAGAGGLFYYIENDEHPYYLDQGERLYYRDSSGRLHYVEDVEPGAVVEPEVIIRRTTPGVVLEPRSMVPPQSCSEQWEECMSGCQGISPRQSYDRPGCIENCDTIRSHCTGP
jgi:hypothetical protein